MKKVLIGIAAVIALLIGAYKIIQITAYGGTSYYTKITTDGKRVQEKDDSGKIYYQYEYDQAAYQKDGNKKNIEFNADHNLRKTAYLKLTLNKDKGVTDWREVKTTDIPKSALSKIKTNK